MHIYILKTQSKPIFIFSTPKLKTFKNKSFKITSILPILKSFLVVNKSLLKVSHSCVFPLYKLLLINKP